MMDENFTFDSNDYKRKLFERLCGISSNLKIPYPIAHKLSYDYPKVNPLICQNIINCLVKYPKFYEQTLHLMNKMNLPCPLYPCIREPCSIQIRLDSENNSENLSNESEIESENETENEFKRKLAQDTNDQMKKIKVKSILKSMSLSSQEPKNLNLNQVFEKSDELLAQKKNQSKEIKLVCDHIVLNKESNVMSQDKKSNQLINQSSSMQLEPDLFIKREDLLSNKISLNELEKLSIFKNYEKGNKNCKIYLKNLSKKITEEDLKFIYGRFIDWSSEEHRVAFNIRLMKEGRMKGQAFINFPDENIAEKALDETIGYVFDSKPIIAQFAKSSKS